MCDNYYENYSVLIVDEEVKFRTIVKTEIKLLVGQVYEADDDYGAINILKNFHVDLAIIDLKISKMSGFNLIKKINKDFPEIKKVVLTSDLSILTDSLKILEKLNIFDYYVKKSFNIDLLIERIKARSNQIVSFQSDKEWEFEQIFNNTISGMWLIDKEFNLIMVNNIFLKMFGLNRKYIEGKKCYQIWNGPHCNSGKCPSHFIYNTGENKTHEVEINDFAGKKMVCLISSIPYKNSDNIIIGTINNFVDITKRREEEKIKERLIELLNEKNITLKNILNEIEFEKNKIRNDVLQNINKNIKPVLAALKSLHCSCFSTNSATSFNKLKLIENYLDDINNDFYSKIDKLHFNLTPTEKKICQLIKSGHARKEITNMLHVSEGTIKSHSTNIRKKIGLSKNKIHLKHYFTNL